MTDPMGGLFVGLDIATSGMRAELRRTEIAATNLANMNVTRTADGEPYRRCAVLFEELLEDVRGRIEGGDRMATGVRVADVVEDRATPFPEVYDPSHPHADADGKVRLSNVDAFRELVEMAAAERAFQADLAGLRTYRGMLQDTLASFR